MHNRRLINFGYFVLALISASIVAFLLRAYLIIPVMVSGNSMAPNLTDKNQILLTKLSQIKRFDIIVFKDASEHTYIKRVIGLPGESVSYQNDKLYIDGRYIKEPFLAPHQSSVTLTPDFDFSKLTQEDKIPENQYFVLGDNRQISKDSRTFGPIDKTSIIGEAYCVYYPIKATKFIK